MLPRPESQSYTRFLLTAGIFLAIAAFVVPALVLRETDTLRIDREELAGLPPRAKDEIERRQEISRDVGRAVPYVAPALLLLGIALIAIALPRLKRQEEKDDRRSSMEMDKLHRDMEPQSRSERHERFKAEASEEKQVQGEEEEPPARRRERPPVAPAGTGDAARGRERSPAAGTAISQYFQRSIERREEAERKVFERLREIAPRTHELHTNLKFAGGVSPLLLDALFLGTTEGASDIVVEVKVVEGALLQNARNRINEAVALVHRYQERFGRPTSGWLILVARDARGRPAEREAVRAIAREFGDALRVSIVDKDELETLELPFA